jgi:hypothetical protein
MTPIHHFTTPATGPNHTAAKALEGRGDELPSVRRPVDEARRARLLNETASLMNEALSLRAALDAAENEAESSLSLTDLKLLRDDLETLTAALREAHRELAALSA